MDTKVIAIIGVAVVALILVVVFGLEKLMSFFSGIGKSVGSFFGNIGKGAENVASGLAKDAQNAGNAVVSDVSKAGSAVVNSAKTAGSDIKNFANGSAQTIQNFASVTAKAVESNAVKAGSEVSGAVKGVAYDLGHNPVTGSVVKAVSVAKSDVASAGQIAKTDFTTVIKSAPKVYGAVGNSVKQGFNDVGKIASVASVGIASKLQPIDTGIVKGAENAVSNVRNSVASISNSSPVKAVENAGNTVAKTASNTVQSVAKFFHL